MTDKEIAEIRRRYRTDKSNISHVRGCYVNEKKENTYKIAGKTYLIKIDEEEYEPNKNTK